jgi:uncharacterized protein (DUF58 family)
MTFIDVTERIKQLRSNRWWMYRQNNRQRFDKPLLTRKEILDLRYRVEQDRASTVYRHEVEHRTLGDARSVYRGYGMDYDESRPYFPGDELRFMNWRVTARTGEPHMKVFREERKPTVFIVVDRRQNMCFGTRRRLKVSQAVRAAAVTAFDARLNNAPVAGLLLESIHNDVLSQGSSVVLISDFHDLDDDCRSSLLELSMTHHLKAVHLIDPAEKRLPACGSLLLQSDEQTTTAINSSDINISSKYQIAATSYLESKQELFRSLGIECKVIMTDEDRVESVVEV